LLRFQKVRFILFALIKDDARVTTPESNCESAPTSPAIRASVLQQLCQRVSDEEVILLAQVLTPDVQRRIKEHRAEDVAKQSESLPEMEKAPIERTNPSPPSSTYTGLVSEFRPLNLPRTTMPTAQIDGLSDQSTPPIDHHPTEPEIDNQSDYSVPTRHRRPSRPTMETDYLPPLQCSYH
jgi:hypothetical protein